jgi:hypothetical protein
MTDHEKSILVFLAPLLFLAIVHELNRGITILRRNVYSPSIAESIRWKIFGGVTDFSNEQDPSDNKKLSSQQKMSGYYSLIFGITMSIWLIIFIFVALKP